MSLYLRYTCDSCGAKEEDGRDLCSLPCVSRYASEPDAVPAQVYRPDPMRDAFRIEKQAAPTT